MVASSRPSSASAASSSSAVTDVLLDLCGVVIDWQPRRALDGLVDPAIADELMAGDDRRGFMYFDDLLDGGVPLDDVLARYELEQGPVFAEALRTYYEHQEGGLVRLMPGMRELMEDLRACGIRLWALTNWSRETWHVCFERFAELEGLLGGVVVSGIEGCKKPDERIYRIALDRFGLDPERTVFVDDNQLNVDAAMRLGIDSINFGDEPALRRELIERGIELPERSAAEAEGPDTAGAPAGETSRPAVPQEVHLQALNDDPSRSRWECVRLGDITFPGNDEPYVEGYALDFWNERRAEYNRLGWHRLDWANVREQLSTVAAQLAQAPDEMPEFDFTCAGPAERTFLEMWFGYGEPRGVEVRPNSKGDGYVMGYGQHRVCALADFPMDERDRTLMGIGERGFVDADPLGPDTLLPMLVMRE